MKQLLANSFFKNTFSRSFTFTSPCPLQRGIFSPRKSHFESYKRIFWYLLFFILLVKTIQNTNAQSVSYYPFNSQLSIATNPTKVVWMDFRFQMNSFTASLNTEPTLMVNLAYTGNANFYVGGGANLGIVGAIIDNRKLVNGYFGSFGVRAYPFKEARKVSINFELSPYVEQDGQSGFFRAWLGVGYHFGGKNN
ncbi:MAG: hypothetical protein U5N85_17320 [Arcicella sp.]|nr:hypothetical protein [Arcicella sp.]